MGWEIHPAKTAFPAFAGDWDRLNAGYFDSHPLYDSRFVGPLLEYFANGKERLCIYRDQGTVTGALILRSDGVGRWSSFRPSQSQATAILLNDASLLETLFKALPGFVWTIQYYAVDPRYSPDFSQLDLMKIISANARTIGIHPDLTFVEFWEQRSKNLKANVRRYFNRAEKELSKAELVVMAVADDMPVGVARFGELESAGWKAAAGTAVSGSNQQGKFYSDVLARFARSGDAKVYELRLNDQLAASRLVITSARMLVILKTTYDEDLARFAPGRVLLYRLIEEQLENRTGKTLEFYTNATRDQADWSTFGCTIHNIQVFRNDTAANSFSLLKVFQRALRGRKKRRPPPDSLIPRANVKACDSVNAITAENRELDKFAARASFENSIDWFDLLQQQIYPDDPGVRFYFAADADVPTTILPLRLTKRGGTKTVESLGNFYTSLYTPLQSEDSDPSVFKEILAAATRDHGGAHVMRFHPMDPESPNYRALLNALQAIGWIPFRYFCFGNWFLRVNEGWDAYLKKRGVNLRSKIKRMSRKFAAEGGLLEIVTPEQVEPAIAAFQEVYMASWKVPEPYPDFVPSLIRRLAPLGMLRLGVARLQGRPIAAQLWIFGEDKASIYKVAYHEDFASYSPGTVLTAHLMQHVIEEDHVKEVDFLIGDDRYKQIWMSDRRERWGIIAFNPRTMIGFLLFVKEVLARATRSLRGKIKWRLGETKAHGRASKSGH